jgi:predicted nucleic acid-binding protein
MPLDAFPDGGRIFVDANIFLYHCWNQSPSCSRLVGRIELGLIHGVTSTTVLNEVTHRLLIAEAISRYPRIARHPTRFLKRHPAVIRTLSQTPLIIERLTHLPLQVISLTPVLWHRAALLSHEFGLLMNDAIIVACLRRLRLHHLASADRDFRLIRNVTVWYPN